MAKTDSTPNPDKIIASAQGANANPPTGDDGLYFPVPIAAAQDRALSFAARGVLAYLLSKPEDWHVVIADLCQQCGRDKVQSILRELERHGYVGRAGLPTKSIIGETHQTLTQERHLEAWLVAAIRQTNPGLTYSAQELGYWMDFYSRYGGHGWNKPFILARQLVLPGGRADLVLKHPNDIVNVIELKRGTLGIKAVEQVLRYMGDIRIEACGILYDAPTVSGVLVGASVTPEALHAATRFGILVYLYRFDGENYSFTLQWSENAIPLLEEQKSAKAVFDAFNGGNR